MQTSKIGFGGGCHWCTEAVFKSLKGVQGVDQGWIKAQDPYDTYSEAVLVHYDESVISTKTLIEVHLLTHASTVAHSMRDKYRSAVYVFAPADVAGIEAIINDLAKRDKENYLTKVLVFEAFKMNDESFLDYYEKNAGNQFCTRYISPKLDAIRAAFSTKIKDE